MLYLVRYKDGFIIGAGGESPQEAIDKAASSTARPFDDVDAVTERDTTFVCYDHTRGWLAPKSEPRGKGGLVDVNTGEVVGQAPEPKPVEGIELDKPTDPEPEPVVDAEAPPA